MAAFGPPSGYPAELGWRRMAGWPGTGFYGSTWERDEDKSFGKSGITPAQRKPSLFITWKKSRSIYFLVRDFGPIFYSGIETWKYQIMANRLAKISAIKDDRQPRGFDPFEARQYYTDCVAGEDGQPSRSSPTSARFFVFPVQEGWMLKGASMGRSLSVVTQNDQKVFSFHSSRVSGFLFQRLSRDEPRKHKMILMDNFRMHHKRRRLFILWFSQCWTKWYIWMPRGYEF